MIDFDFTDENIKEAQSKGVWTMIPAIYGPEGLDTHKLDMGDMYNRLSKEITEDGERSIYAHGFVLGLVVQYDKQMVVSPLTGDEKALRFFHNLLKVNEKYEKLYAEIETIAMEILKGLK